MGLFISSMCAASTYNFPLPGQWMWFIVVKRGRRVALFNWLTVLRNVGLEASLEWHCGEFVGTIVLSLWLREGESWSFFQVMQQMTLMSLHRSVGYCVLCVARNLLCCHYDTSAAVRIFVISQVPCSVQRRKVSSKSTLTLTGTKRHLHECLIRKWLHAYIYYYHDASLNWRILLSDVFFSEQSDNFTLKKSNSKLHLHLQGSHRVTSGVLQFCQFTGFLPMIHWL